MSVEIADVRLQVETDLDAVALQAIVNAAREAVDERLGPIGPLTVTRHPAGRLIGLPRRAIEILSVVERDVTLEAADWLLRPSGLIVERLRGRSWHGRVEVVFQPLPDTATRDQAVIALVKLDVGHHPGLVSARFGSWAETYSQQGGLSYGEEREAILAALTKDEGLIR